jgi:hypothetical protein
MRPAAKRRKRMQPTALAVGGDATSDKPRRGDRNYRDLGKVPRFEKHVPLPTRVARVCAVALPNTLTDAKVRA